MTSLLGISITGDACVCVYSPEDAPLPGPGDAGPSFANAKRERDAIREGFEQLFGAQVRLGYQLKFYSPEDRVPEEPSQVARYFCVSADDLETPTQLQDRVLAGRTTPEDNWLLREFDTSRLVESAAEARRASPRCPEEAE